MHKGAQTLTRQTAAAGFFLLAAMPSLIWPTTSLAADRPIALRTGFLIDGSGSEPIKDALIVIEGKRIRAVGRSSDVTLPPDAEIIDFRDKVIIPGLVDSHAHYREWQGELYVANGVTTAFDIGDNPLAWSFAQKEGIEKGKIVGPRLLLGGRINGFGGEDTGEGGSRGRPEGGVKTADQARDETRRLLAMGVDAIKALEALSPELLRVIVEEAHRAGRPVITHSVNGTEAVLAGIPIDDIEHSHSVMMGTVASEETRRRLEEGRSRQGERLTSQEAHDFSEEAQYDRVINKLVAGKVHWSPTMATAWRAFSPLRKQFAAEEARLFSLPSLNYIPPYFRENAEHYFAGTANLSPKLQASVGSGYSKLKNFISRFAKAGGKLQTGSDPNAGIPAISVHQEMALFVEAGLTPMQALLAATRNPAERLGRDKDFGLIAEGRFADLVVLDANPLDDITATQRIHLVFQEGRAVKPEYHANYRNPIPRPKPDRQAPEIERVSPEVFTEGDGAATLTITGRNFLSTSVVKFDGKPVPAEPKYRVPNFPQNFLRSRELVAKLPAELLAKAGTYAISVEHPGVGGAVSNTAYLLVKFR